MCTPVKVTEAALAVHVASGATAVVALGGGSASGATPAIRHLGSRSISFSTTAGVWKT